MVVVSVFYKLLIKKIFQIAVLVLQNSFIQLTIKCIVD